MEKQVLATLLIANHEVRLVAAEFFNSRLNIIKTERVSCSGMDGMRIVDVNKVVLAIRQAADSVSEFISTPLTAVLLAVPSYRFKRETVSLSATIDNPEGRITADDIRQLYQRAQDLAVSSDLVCVNTVCNTYRLNGIIYRSMPLNEKGDLLEAEFDRLCADKMMVYSYAAAVEKAGLQIIDICLDAYASAKEMALFEQNLKNYVINMQLEMDNLNLGLIYNGRLMSCQMENIGYAAMAQAVSRRFGIPLENSVKLLFKYAHLDPVKIYDRPVYAFTRDENTYTITDKQLSETIAKPLQDMLNDCCQLCAPILAHDNVTVIVQGAGGDLDGIGPALSHCFEKPVKVYCPETLGVRSPGWTVCLGMFYAYLDQSDMHQQQGSAVDEQAYAALIGSDRNNVVAEKNFTAKLKKILFMEPKK